MLEGEIRSDYRSYQIRVKKGHRMYDYFTEMSKKNSSIFLHEQKSRAFPHL